jgi:hypothetical protein
VSSTGTAAASSIASGTPSTARDRRDVSVAVVHGEGTHVLGTVKEQADTVELRQHGHRDRAPSAGQVIGGMRHAISPTSTAPDSSRDTNRWAAPQELVHSARPPQVLAVVENEQHLLLGEHMGKLAATADAPAIRCDC